MDSLQLAVSWGWHQTDCRLTWVLRETPSYGTSWYVTQNFWGYNRDMLRVEELFAGYLPYWTWLAMIDYWLLIGDNGLLSVCWASVLVTLSPWIIAGIGLVADHLFFFYRSDYNGFAQSYGNSSTLAMELLQSWTKPLIQRSVNIKYTRYICNISVISYYYSTMILLKPYLLKAWHLFNTIIFFQNAKKWHSIPHPHGWGMECFLWVQNCDLYPMLSLSQSL